MSSHHPRRRFLRSLSSGIVALSALAGPVAAGRATRIDACTTITEPGRYELAGDVTHDASGICVRVQASNVTLDGRGYAIRGTGASGTIGVSIDEASEHVVVRNLTVTGVTNGFNLVGPGTRLQEVEASGNGISGVVVNPAARRTRVTDSVVSRNGSGGIAVVKADDHHIVGNRIRSNGRNGIVFRQGVSRSTVRRNDCSRNGERGVAVWEGGDRNRFLGNAIADNNRHGLAVNDRNPEPARDLLVRGNAVVGNGDDGTSLRQVATSRVLTNAVRGNGGDGIALADSDDNLLVRNVVCENGGGAVVLDADSTGNRLRANRTDCRTGSGHDWGGPRSDPGSAKR